MVHQELPTRRFVLPEQAAYVKALGYAYGLSKGMVAPLHHEHMPPYEPIQMKTLIATNDQKQFDRLLAEGHELGFQFGKQASRELAQTLTILPVKCWWAVLMYFAGERMELEPEEIPDEWNAPVEQGLRAFRRIYRRWTDLRGG